MEPLPTRASTLAETSRALMDDARGVLAECMDWLASDPDAHQLRAARGTLEAVAASCWPIATFDQLHGLIDALRNAEADQAMIHRLSAAEYGKAMLTGTPADLARAQVRHGQSLHAQARLAEARSAYQHAAVLAEAAGDEAARLRAREAMVQVAMSLGDYSDAVHQLLQIASRARRDSDEALLLRTLVDLTGAFLRTGENERVRSSAAEALELALRLGELDAAVSVSALAIRTELRRDERDTARRQLARTERWANRSGSTLALGTARTLRARLTSLDHGLGAATPVFEQALAAAERLGAPWAAAQVELVWGEAALYCGEKAVARPHFQRVVDLMAASGADFLVRVARAGLAGCRGEPIEWQGSEILVQAVVTPSSKLDLLSPRERQVAELVADGRTNQQIATRLDISPRTVEDHVGKICRKLGVDTRAGIGRSIAEV